MTIRLKCLDAHSNHKVGLLFSLLKDRGNLTCTGKLFLIDTSMKYLEKNDENSK